MGDLITPIKEPIMAMAIKMWGYVPHVIAAIIILLVGLVAAKILADIIVRLLKIAKLDVVSGKSGLANMLKVGEIKLSLSEILGTVIYWLLVLIVAVTAAEALKFKAAADLMEKVIGYVPNVLAAILVLAGGALLASILGSVVLAGAKNAGLKKAQFLAQIVKVALIVFATAIALEQLRIGAHVIAQVISIIIMSLGTGFALAFGLGCKDMVAKWVDNFIKSFK